MDDIQDTILDKVAQKLAEAKMAQEAGKADNSNPKKRVITFAVASALTVALLGAGLYSAVADNKRLQAEAVATQAVLNRATELKIEPIRTKVTCPGLYSNLPESTYCL